MAVLETERLRLRPFAPGDAGDVYAYAKDPRVGPVAGWPAHQSEEESREIIRTVFSAPGVYAMELKRTGQVIGSVGFVGNHPAGKHPDCLDDEIGYALGTAFWGRGLMPEAVNAVLEYGFTQMDLQRIWCGHYQGNWRSARVIGKCGFRYQFARTEAVPLLGKTQQSYLYLQAKEEWHARVSGSL
ncbi:GNAT family N-acetyltransferase [Dysosmobacter sp.]